MSVEHSDAVGLEGVPHVQRVVVVPGEQDAPRGTENILISLSIFLININCTVLIYNCLT